MRFLKISSKDVVLFSCLFPDLICNWTRHKTFRRSPRKHWIDDPLGPGLSEALIPPEKSRSCVYLSGLSFILRVLGLE